VRVLEDQERVAYLVAKSSRDQRLLEGVGTLVFHGSQLDDGELFSHLDQRR